MRTNHPYDDASIAAQCSVRNLLAVGAREQMLHETRRPTAFRVPIAEVGRLLVRFGQWLQTLARQPNYQEETI